MILGLSHVGATVKDLDDSLRFYEKTMGFHVLSDAERKGEWIDKVTGIPNFHTRTVYLSVTPYQHLELFGFFNPKVVPAEKTAPSCVRISCCAMIAGGLDNLKGLTNAQGDEELPDSIRNGLILSSEKCRNLSLQDPSQLNLRIIGPKEERSAKPASFEVRSLFPVIVVQDIEGSLGFYRDTLDLEIGAQGNTRAESEGIPEKEGCVGCFLKRPVGSVSYWFSR